MDIKGKKIAVVGLGVSGKAAAELCRQKGASVYVTDMSDSKKTQKAARQLEREGVSVELGQHTEVSIGGSEFVVVSPGVQDNSDAMKIAQDLGISVISEIELGYMFCQAPIIAVTGTNAKSTIITLIGLILKASGKDPIVCGNIGDAFCGFSGSISRDQIAVCEVSSFQLKWIDKFKPKVSCITNITQNHFDWHADFREYFDCKRNIYRNQDQDDIFILNYDDPKLRMLEKDIKAKVYFFSMHEKVEGAYFNGKDLVLNIGGLEEDIMPADDILLKGKHNISNVLCALLCAYPLGAVGDGMKTAVSGFSGLLHRFQCVADIDNVTYIDDSKATTVDAANAALLSCTEKVILIAGGRDKGSDFSVIKDTISEKVKELILIGEASAKIRTALKDNVNMHQAENMDDAVRISRMLAGPGETVLLSPMCASFDMYKDYKDRGEDFCRAVEELKKY